jgi:hypothetical protein
MSSQNIWEKKKNNQSRVRWTKKREEKEDVVAENPP